MFLEERASILDRRFTSLSRGRGRIGSGASKFLEDPSIFCRCAALVEIDGSVVQGARHTHRGVSTQVLAECTPALAGHALAALARAGAKARKACKEGGCGHAIAPGRTGPGFPLHTDHAFRRGRELRTSDGAAARAGGARWRPRRESGSNGPHSARRRRGWRSRRVLLPVLPVLPLARIFSEVSLCSRATPRKWRQGRRTADLSLRRWSAGLKRSRRRCSRWQHSPTEQWLRPAL